MQQDYEFPGPKRRSRLARQASHGDRAAMAEVALLRRIEAFEATDNRRDLALQIASVFPDLNPASDVVVDGYWRGDSDRESMQTAFAGKSWPELDAALIKRELAWTGLHFARPEVVLKFVPAFLLGTLEEREWVVGDWNLRPAFASASELSQVQRQVCFEVVKLYVPVVAIEDWEVDEVSAVLDALKGS